MVPEAVIPGGMDRLAASQRASWPGLMRQAREEGPNAVLFRDVPGGQGMSVPQGVKNIPTEQSRTNVAYGTLTTPDQVTGVVLPTDGLIFVAFEALWKSSVVATIGAAVFLGANQLKKQGQGAPVVSEVTHALDATDDATYGPVYTAFLSAGAQLWSGISSIAHTSSVTTGQLIGFGGAFLPIHAAAGTYTVSVQFKASTGSVTVKERKLWVSTMEFPAAA